MNFPILGRLVTIPALAVALAASPTADAAAQTTRHGIASTVWSDPAIATLLLVEQLPAPATANAGAVLIRRPGDPPNNIILVTRATTPHDLSRAVTALAFSRRSRGDLVEREMRTAVRAAPGKPGLVTRDERRADGDLRRVGLAPEFVIPGIARGPAIVIRMADAALTKPAAKRPAPTASPPR